MSVINSLLLRAELCYERGQHKIVSSYLIEIDNHFNAGEEATDNEYERYEWLCEHAPVIEEGEEVKVNDACTKCGGSKTYIYASGNTGMCYDCQGKGYQTEKDLVRVKNYWAYRRGREQKAMAAAVQSFPF